MVLWKKNYGAMEKKLCYYGQYYGFDSRRKKMVDYQNLSNFIFNVKMYGYMQKWLKFLNKLNL